MKRTDKNSNESERYTAHRLTWADVEEIKNILKSHPKEGEDLELRVNDFLLDSEDELIDFKQKKVTYLRMKRLNPYLSFEFEENTFRVYRGDSDDIAKGIFSRLSNYISKKKRRTILSIMTVLEWFGILLTGSLIWIKFYILIGIDETPLKSLHTTPFIILGCFLYFGCIYKKRKMSYIDQKEEGTNFFTRNNAKNIDRLITLFSGIIIGIASTVGGQLIIQKMTS